MGYFLRSLGFLHQHFVVCRWSECLVHLREALWARVEGSYLGQQTARTENAYCSDACLV